MDVATKLETGVPTVGSHGSELSKLCRKFRVQLRKVIALEAQKPRSITTLNAARSSVTLFS